MSKPISVRLPDNILKELEELSINIDRDKTYIIIKALKEYLSEYSDYLIALERLNDKNDEIISSDEFWKEQQERE